MSKQVEGETFQRVGEWQMAHLEFWGLATLPEVRPGDDLALLIWEACGREGLTLREDDVVVVTSKVVSKAEGRVFPLEGIRPGWRARAVARATGRDPKLLQVILDQSRSILGEIPLGLAHRYLGALPLGEPERVSRVLAEDRGLLLTVLPSGLVCTDAGVDGSNVPGAYAALPPDPDASAARLRAGLERLAGCRLGVVIADTEMKLLRMGSEDIAVGASGVQPMKKEFGAPDRLGRPKFGGVDAVADMLCSGAALLMGQTSAGVAAVVVRGLQRSGEEAGASSLAIPASWLGLGLAFLLYSRVKIRLYLMAYGLADLFGRPLRWLRRGRAGPDRLRM
ncbi:MAG: coenzyme F420-0:L-glutamate ligase [Acetobacteraceae bacterium]|nr:coenzyme F420-0:L-glutamate ligase [Acetobacteraceae bacterium]